MNSDEDIETVATGQFLSLKKIGRWEYAARNKATPVVIVVPLTDDGKLVFVEQFRAPVKNTVIEFPAGLAGDIAGLEDEALEDAALRELEEETGYRAAGMRRVYTGPSSAGLCDEVSTIFLADKLQLTGEGGGVDGERITPHEIPRSSVHQWLQSQQQAGLYVASRVYTGLYFLNQMEL